MAGIADVRKWISVHPGAFAFAIATILFSLAYALVFVVTGATSGPVHLFQVVSVNVLSAVLLGALCMAIIRTFLITRPSWLQLAGHLLLAVSYACIWYVTVISIFGLMGGSAIDGFSVTGFNMIAFVWQVFQGVALYSIVAAGSYALWYRERLILAEARSSTPADAPRQRLLIRTDDEFANVDADAIVWIAAQDDYSELVTEKRRVLIRKSLGALEAMLPADRFLRIHRSAIVNLDAVEQVEPAGNGRLSLHMKNGETVTSSRAGAKALRERTL